MRDIRLLGALQSPKDMQEVIHECANRLQFGHALRLSVMAESKGRIVLDEPEASPEEIGTQAGASFVRQGCALAFALAGLVGDRLNAGEFDEL